MSISTKTSKEADRKQLVAAVPQIQIQSGLRAGGASGPCDVNYWRTELNYWKQLANQMGCA